MSTSQQQIESSAGDKGRVYVSRRREVKDTLLGDEPPRALSLSIMVIAIFLGTLVTVSRSIEYEDTVTIILTLKLNDSSTGVYAEGYLQQQDLGKVRTGQAVRLEFSNQAAEQSCLETSVTDISAMADGALYLVRVELPDDLITVHGLRPASEQKMQARGQVVTQRLKLFDKMFGMFRSLLELV